MEPPTASFEKVKEEKEKEYSLKSNKSNIYLM